jgi:hypothetical protein
LNFGWRRFVKVLATCHDGCRPAVGNANFETPTRRFNMLLVSMTPVTSLVAPLAILDAKITPGLSLAIHNALLGSILADVE